MDRNVVLLGDEERIANVLANDVKFRVIQAIPNKGVIVQFYSWLIVPGELRVRVADVPDVTYIIPMRKLKEEQIEALPTSVYVKLKNS